MVAFAQQTLAQRNAEAFDKHEEKIQDLQNKLDILLGQARADREAQRKATETGKKEAGKIAAGLGHPDKLRGVKNTINNLPDNSVPTGFKDNMTRCIEDITKEFGTQIEALNADQLPAEVANANFFSASASGEGGCNQTEMNALFNRLQDHKQKTVGAWKQCRKTLINAGVITSLDIPSDPSGLKRDSDNSDRKNNNIQLVKNLANIANQTAGLADDVKQCSENLKKFYDDIRHQEDAAAAMAMMMNMVANICASSGGNPYVCGAAFLLAFLASLFSKGGGDGDGDGKSDGTGEKGDGTNIPGMGTGQGPGPLKEKPKQVPKPNPDKTSEHVARGTGGNWTCLTDNKKDVITLTCHDKSNNNVLFSYKKPDSQGENHVLTYLNELHNKTQRYTLALCGNSDLMNGIVIYYDNNNYLPIRAERKEGSNHKYDLYRNENINPLDLRGKLVDHCRSTVP